LISNDKIGDVTIPINNLVQGEETINIYKLKNVSKGEIQLGLTLEIDDSPEVEIYDLVSVKVMIKSAKNLIQPNPKEKPNPYAILYFGDKYFMTNKISKELEPKWKGQEYRWSIEKAHEKIILPIVVFDKRSSKKDEFLGLALVPLAGVNNEEKVSFYTLHGVDKGEIEISISTSRPKMEIAISDPTIHQKELEKKVKFSNQFISMSKNSQAGGLKKFGKGFASYLGVAWQFVVDNSDDLGSLVSSIDGGGGGGDDGGDGGG